MLARAVVTLHDLYDPDISTQELLIAGLHNVVPGSAPGRRAITRHFRFLDADDYASALRTAAEAGRYKVDRRDNKHGEAVRLTPLVRTSDTRAPGNHQAHLPLLPLRRLGGSRSADAVRLLWLLHSEQHYRRGAVQLSDEIAAWYLGWAAKRAQRARMKLLGHTLIHQVTAARRGHAAVYTIPENIGAPVNLDPATGFNATQTRHLRTVAISDDERATIIASDAEREIVKRRLYRDGAGRARFRQLVAQRTAEKPRTPYVHVKRDRVLSTVLPTPTSLEDLRRLDRENLGYEMAEAGL